MGFRNISKVLSSFRIPLVLPVKLGRCATFCFSIIEFCRQVDENDRSKVLEVENFMSPKLWTYDNKYFPQKCFTSTQGGSRDHLECPEDVHDIIFGFEIFFIYHDILVIFHVIEMMKILWKNISHKCFLGIQVDCRGLLECSGDVFDIILMSEVFHVLFFFL